MDVDEYARNLVEEVLASAETAEEGEFQEGAFTRLVLEILTECGETIDPQLCFYRSTGRKLNAYDYLTDSDGFDLFVSEFDNRPEIHSISRADIAAMLRRCRRVLEDALGGFWEGLEESTEIFDLADSIHRKRKSIQSVRIFLLTNRRARAEIFDDELISGINVTHYVWDIDRLFQVISHSLGRSKIAVDFPGEFGGEGIACLASGGPADEYTTYLALVPGEILAKIYARWGQRLLERNVRAFLQARGAVNRGIRQTLTTTPEWFLAYNNGISATADSVRVEMSGQVQRIVFAENLQIVNGGQTTASIYEAFQRKLDLSAVYVQMKLSILRDPTMIDAVVPLISQYANSQTKVSLSDFSANHPFHIELEKISRQEWAPNPDTRAKATSHWYYERARGQYQDDSARQSTATQRATWRLQNPKNQVLTKTDVARYEMVWNQSPHIVSRGSEKNFSAFCLWVSRVGAPVADLSYFRHLVAKAILFRDCDAIVRRLEFGGYKANVNAYTIAWLSFCLKKDPSFLDGIWSTQTITPIAAQLIEILARRVWEHITSPTTATRNVTEWCKREVCWTTLRDSEVPSLKRDSATVHPARSRIVNDSGGIETTLPPTEEHAEGKISSAVWEAIGRWGVRTNNLRLDESDLCAALGQLTASNSAITSRQHVAGLGIYAKAMQKGFTRPVDLSRI